ncbi:VOC family protein [Planctobacterium marinum]|uniref:VOC family protein n=1 Tax=Planctobacterium marinum TaxID=1631968 RepID=UPI001E3AE201|nr:VOC family protein [Planctobacterium marinum]MCC2607580.1 VOC family protein [Planctobacterium marinum]
MIGYITLGTNDVLNGGIFYDQLFAILGAKRVYDQANCIAWAKDDASVIFTLLNPENGQQATAGNGTMIAFQAASQAQVESLYYKALEIGASDEGAPGIRSGGFYCAYIRDLDGNKLNFHFNPNGTE